MSARSVITDTLTSAKRERFVSLRFLNTKAIVGLSIVGLFVVVAIFAPVIAPGNPSADSYLPNLSPGSAHWLGTTSFGQGVLRQVVWGARGSLLVSFLAGGITTFVAVAVGVTSGLLLGWTDRILSFLTNVFLVIPSLPLLIVLSSYLPSKGDLIIILVISMTSWAYSARTLRSQVLSLRERDFVLHAKLVGQPWWSIVFGEILPNMGSLVVSGLLYSMIGALLTVTSLDFLGVGNISAVSWGSMLYWAQNNGALLNGLWWWFVPPGVAITLFGGALALLNFSLDEITNPRLRQRKVKVRGR
ncbi:MAG: ABC transporter permease [Thermaerobacter sp.]|nr:ABC transporter permease [Thermaerobacter sp.]